MSHEELTPSLVPYHGERWWIYGTRGALLCVAFHLQLTRHVMSRNLLAMHVKLLELLLEIVRIVAHFTSMK